MNFIFFLVNDDVVLIMYGLILIDYDEDYDEDFDYWGDDDVEDLENFDEEYFVSEKVFFLLVGKDEDYFLNLGY